VFSRVIPEGLYLRAALDGVGSLLPNGIPDAMEFKMLETVLKDATLDLGFEGGVMNWHVYQDCLHNLAQARADFSCAPGGKGMLSSSFPRSRLFGARRMINRHRVGNMRRSASALLIFGAHLFTLQAYAVDLDIRISDVQESEGQETKPGGFPNPQAAIGMNCEMRSQRKDELR
jgi:hypothetical protein